ncbi:hypothetical protein MANES_09G152900v8 [Manihot esculenta]|uniref:Uncharacterized protein n=1 Tax=Manihot esculenta TaxID=3983 RepID=A0ACB7H8G1_MANES|nr:hypothetical protein MANES_09G152900v8 [Manihot esculenta]
MHCYWRGIRFLSTTTRSKRNNWDPTVSLELNHPSLVLLEKSNTRDHFKQILGQMMRSNLIGQTFPMSRLIFFSAISHPENLDMALLLFNHFTPNPNLYIYNTMISALSFATNQSFVVYNSMLSSGIDPDKHTLLNLLHAAKHVLEVKQIHCHAIALGLTTYRYMQNSLIKMYLENGLFWLANQLFEQMLVPDVVSFNIMIDGYAKKGYGLEAVQLLHEMIALGLKSDEFTMLGLLVSCGQLKEARFGKAIHAWIERRKSITSSNLILGNALVDMYIKCQELVLAQRAFSALTEKDIVSWNTIIAGCAKAGKLELARRFFNQMPSRDLVSWNSLIAGYACQEIGALDLGREIIEKDVMVWTTMITGFAFHGYGRKALELFSEMQEDVTPNEVTFVSVLAACSHSGLIDQGLKIFNCMKEYGIEPRIEHYGCLVDLLGRSGRLAEAIDVIEMMPVKPSRSIWGSILNACRVQGDMEMGERALSELLKLEPEEEGGYMLLSNIYAANGRWSYSDKIRETMESRGVKKTAGCSSVVIDGVIHDFVAADKWHPRWMEETC